MHWFPLLLLLGTLLACQPAPSTELSPPPFFHTHFQPYPCDSLPIFVHRKYDFPWHRGHRLPAAVKDSLWQVLASVAPDTAYSIVGGAERPSRSGAWYAGYALPLSPHQTGYLLRVDYGGYTTSNPIYGLIWNHRTQCLQQYLQLTELYNVGSTDVFRMAQLQPRKTPEGYDVHVYDRVTSYVEQEQPSGEWEWGYLDTTVATAYTYGIPRWTITRLASPIQNPTDALMAWVQQPADLFPQLRVPHTITTASGARPLLSKNVQHRWKLLTAGTEAEATTPTALVGRIPLDEDHTAYWWWSTAADSSQRTLWCGLYHRAYHGLTTVYAVAEATKGGNKRVWLGPLDADGVPDWLLQRDDGTLEGWVWHGGAYYSYGKRPPQAPFHHWFTSCSASDTLHLEGYERIYDEDPDYWPEHRRLSDAQCDTLARYAVDAGLHRVWESNAYGDTVPTRHGTYALCHFPLSRRYDAYVVRSRDDRALEPTYLLVFDREAQQLTDHRLIAAAHNPTEGNPYNVESYFVRRPDGRVEWGRFEQIRYYGDDWSTAEAQAHRFFITTDTLRQAQTLFEDGEWVPLLHWEHATYVTDALTAAGADTLLSDERHRLWYAPEVYADSAAADRQARRIQQRYTPYRWDW